MKDEQWEVSSRQDVWMYMGVCVCKFMISKILNLEMISEIKSLLFEMEGKAVRGN